MSRLFISPGYLLLNLILFSATILAQEKDKIDFESCTFKGFSLKLKMNCVTLSLSKCDSHPSTGSG